MKTSLKNIITILILFLIIILGAYFRFHSITNFTIWGGDDVRDILVAKHMIEYNENKFIRPYCVGCRELGFLSNSPVYFWFLALLWPITRSAQGMINFFALLGTLIIPICFLIAYSVLGRKSGMAAAFLVAISPKMISYSHTVFQPYLVPFFTCLSLLFLSIAIKKKDYILLFISAFFLFLAINIHYSSILILPTLIFWWLKSIKWKTKLKKQKQILLVAFGLFLIQLAVIWYLLTYPFRHKNIPSLTTFTKSLKSLLKHFSLNPKLSFSRLTQNFSLILKNSSGFSDYSSFQGIITLLIIASCIFITISNKKKKAFFLLSLFMGIPFLIFYPGMPLQTYYIPIYPFIFIFFSQIVNFKLTDKKTFFGLLLLGPFSLTLIRKDLFLLKNPPPSNFNQSKKIASLIYQDYQENFFENNSYKLDIFFCEKQGHSSQWATPNYWYFLEEYSQQRLVELVPHFNNIEPICKNPKVFYLIFRTANQKYFNICLNTFYSRHSDWTDASYYNFSNSPQGWEIIRMEKIIP